MKQAILSAEDDRFLREHSGIDYLGILRAAVTNLIGGGKSKAHQRLPNRLPKLFLTGEKHIPENYTKHFYPSKIESNLSKDQIFELYMNQIFLASEPMDLVLQPKFILANLSKTFQLQRGCHAGRPT